MTEWVSYIELAEQYERSAQQIYEMIRKWTEKLHGARGEMVYKLKSELAMLYIMRREALETATKLRGYSMEKEVTS